MRSYEGGMLSSDRLIKLKMLELAFGFYEIFSKYFVGHRKGYLFVYSFIFSGDFNDQMKFHMQDE